MEKFSIVIPAYNEEEIVASLVDEVKSVFKNWNKKLEIIVIDDGSTDSTRKVIKSKKNIKLIGFDKNYGQSYALDAGIKEASGDYIITMDADGQNDPADIPAMFKKLKTTNADLICGWRKNRKDPQTIKLGAIIAAKVRKLWLNDKTIDSGCTLKLFKKETAEELNLFKGMHRFIPAILKIKGKKVIDMKVNHRPRTTGKTKYNWLKYFPGSFGMITVWLMKKRKERKGNFPLLIMGVLLLAVGIINYLFLVPLLINVLFSLLIISFSTLLFITDSAVDNFYNYKPIYKIEEFKEL